MVGLRFGKVRMLSLATVCVAGLIAFGADTPLVFASKGDLVSIQKQSAQPPLKITLGKADVVTLQGDVSDVLVANPSVIDVQAIQSNKLYIVGSQIGDTNIIVLDSAGDVVKRLDVHVTYDLAMVQSMVESLFPDENVKVGSVHDQIILTGTVSTPEVAAKIGNFVAHYVSDLQNEGGKTIDELISNLLEIRGEQQVMLKVKIVEAKRSVLKELGLETRANDPDELAVSTIFGATQSSSLLSGANELALSGGGAFGLSGDEVAIGRALVETGLRGVGTLGFFLNALEEQDLINVLAEPNLTAVSGQQAGFLAGGEFPVPTGRDQVGNLTIEFREFGVSLNFKPVVLSDKRINLQLNTEVSSLDNTNAIVLAGLTVPGLDIRRAETTVEIPSGGSIMIAGLLQSEATKALSGIPGISKTPVLGDLMKSDSFRRDESELVVIVTGYLVEPYGDKTSSDNKPKEQEGEMSKIFAANIRRKFEVTDETIFEAAGPFGYMLD